MYQFHPVIAYGDAIGNDSFALESLLWRHGARSRLYAAHAHDEVAAFVRPWRDLERPRGRRGSVGAGSGIAPGGSRRARCDF